VTYSFVVFSLKIFFKDIRFLLSPLKSSFKYTHALYYNTWLLGYGRRLDTQQDLRCYNKRAVNPKPIGK